MLLPTGRLVEQPSLNGLLGILGADTLWPPTEDALDSYEAEEHGHQHPRPSHSGHSRQSGHGEGRHGEKPTETLGAWPDARAGSRTRRVSGGGAGSPGWVGLSRS